MPDITTGKVNGGFNLFIDGKGYAARVTELELPKLKIKTEDHQPGGYDAPVKIDLGMEAIEAIFTIGDFDADALKYMGVGHNNPVACTIRGSLAHGNGEDTPLVAQLQGMWSEVEPPKFKRGEKFEQKITVACKYYKLELGGKVIHEIDIENMVRMVDGKDYLAASRASIGM